MTFIAIIGFLFLYGMVIIAPNLFYSAQGVAFRKKQNLGVTGVQVYTGLITLFILGSIASGMQGGGVMLIALLMISAAAALLIIPALLIRKKTKKEMIESGFITTTIDRTNKDEFR